jgi:hypothetical protein
MACLFVSRAHTLIHEMRMNLGTADATQLEAVAELRAQVAELEQRLTQEQAQGVSFLKLSANLPKI